MSFRHGRHTMKLPETVKFSQSTLNLNVLAIKSKIYYTYLTDCSCVMCWRMYRLRLLNIVETCPER